MTRKTVEIEYHRKQLHDFLIQKIESKTFIDAQKKANVVKMKRVLDKMKEKFFDSYHEAIKELES